MSESSDTIQLNRKSIAVSVLWVAQLEISPQSRRFDAESHAIRRLFLEKWDRIHLANPGPAAVYLDILLSCITVSHDQVAERPGSAHVARAASMCLLHTLSGVSPKSEVATGIRQRYLRVLPRTASFEALLYCHTMNAIHNLLIGNHVHRPSKWADYKPCAREHVFFAATLVRVAHTRPHGKVPRWALRFAIDSLSRDPPPPSSVVLDCLTIIATDLDCDVSSARTVDLDERCVQGPHCVYLSDPQPVRSSRRFRTS